MRAQNQSRKDRGQALVELMVLLPILLLFMATATPIIVKGTAVPWLDERLYLRHMHADDEHIHSLLLQTHEANLIPQYFDETTLEETAHNISIGTPFIHPSITFPSELTKRISTFTFPDNGLWDLMLMDRSQKQDRQIHRSLTMLTAPVLVETHIAEKVKRLTIIGALSTAISALEKAGINLFHLNLNALPETDRE